MSYAEENVAKKAYLRGYRQHVQRVNRIDAELEEIRIIKSNPAALNNDGMPHGNGKSDLSDYMAEVDQMESELREEREKRAKAYQDIARCIKGLSSKQENDVMFYRYIKGMAFWEIAEKMDITERWAQKIHGRALNNIKISEESAKKVLQFMS